MKIIKTENYIKKEAQIFSIEDSDSDNLSHKPYKLTTKDYVEKYKNWTIKVWYDKQQRLWIAQMYDKNGGEHFKSEDAFNKKDAIKSAKLEIDYEIEQRQKYGLE